MVEVGRQLLRSTGPTPLLKQGHLEQVVQDCVQSSFEHLQGWRFHILSGQPVPAFDHSHSEKVLGFFLCSDTCSYWSG